MNVQGDLNYKPGGFYKSPRLIDVSGKELINKILNLVYVFQVFDLSLVEAKSLVCKYRPLIHQLNTTCHM